MSSLASALKNLKDRVSVKPKKKKASVTAAAIQVHLSGCANFRQRIVYATLSGKSIRIDSIRSGSSAPGLTDYEASFVRLVDMISNGSQVKINETGTTLWYRPGTLIGGSYLTHECPPSRAVGYFIEGLMALAPFASQPLSITLKGVTNNNLDLSVDTLRAVTIPLMERFGIGKEDGGLELKILARGAPPLGGGEVLFSCPTVKELIPVDLTDLGMVKKVRGVVYTTKISPQTANRVVDKVRGVFNDFIPDVYVVTDGYRGRTSGLSPGFGVSLEALTTNYIHLSAEQAAVQGSLPEELGTAVARMLLDEIARGGCVDTCHQSLVMLYMTLCPEDVSRVRIGKLSQHAVLTLRLIQQFFGITFKVSPATARSKRKKRVDEKKKEAEKKAKEDKKKKRKRKKKRKTEDGEDGEAQDEEEEEEEEEEDDKEEEEGSSLPPTIFISCIGTGYKNYNRQTC